VSSGLFEKIESESVVPAKRLVRRGSKGEWGSERLLKLQILVLSINLAQKD
jgi:hypothetical protein